MGAWGTGIWQNDDALDIKEDFAGLIKKFSVEKAVDIISNEEGYWECNNHILAIADLQIAKIGELTDEIRELAYKAVNEELEQIDNWVNCTEREKVLKELARKIKNSRG